MTITKDGDEFIIGSAGLLKSASAPAAATLGNGNIVVVFNETLLFPTPPLTDVDGGVFASILNPLGEVVTGPFQINDSVTSTQNEPRVVALAGGGFAVCWTTYSIPTSSNVDSDIIVRLFDANGTPVSDEIVVSVDDPLAGGVGDDNILSNIIALDDGGFVVSWSANILLDGSPVRGGFAQVYSDAGTATGSETALASNVDFLPDLAQLSDGTIATVFANSTTLFGGGVEWAVTVRLSDQTLATGPSGSGTPIMVQLPYAKDAEFILDPKVSALAEGGMVVAYRYAPTLSTSVLRVEVLDASGAVTGAYQFDAPTGAGTAPQEFDVLGLSSGGFLLTWSGFDAGVQGIYMQAFDADAIPNGDPILVNSAQDGPQFEQALTEMPDGSVFVAFTDQSSTFIDGVMDSLHGAFFAVSGNTPPSGDILGTDEADTLDGTMADDVIRGLAGDDILNGGLGDDVLDGGDGSDTASYADATAGVTANLIKGKATGADGTDSFLSIENLIGSDYNDILVGDFGVNILTGGAGNDVIRTIGGDDTVEAGDGDDKVLGDSGDDLIAAGAGDDLVKSGGGIDRVNGDAGDDILRAGQGDDLVWGDGGNDRVFGNGGDDLLRGGSGDDALFGGGNADVLIGGAGNDALRGDSGRDQIDGGSGDDNLYGGSSRDVFVFADDGASGLDRIKDWEDGSDVLDLIDFAFADFAAIQAIASNAGSLNMKLDFGGGNQVVIENFRLADFDASDVVLM